MSNPAVHLLGETLIKNTRIRVEDNLGESIHIHIGDFRVSLSINEFYSLVSNVQMAADEILSINGLNTSMFDPKAYDWDWLYRYEHITEIKEKYVRIGDLLTKGESTISSDIDVIIPVRESRQYKALIGDKEELTRRKQKNLFGQTNLNRLLDVFDYITRKGYPYDGKFIMVNQYNQILDGDHRAACLLYVKGEDESIPVIQISFDDQPTIKEQIEVQEEQINSYFLKKNNSPKSLYRWSEDLNSLEYSFEEFIRLMVEKKIDFYTIDRPWYREDGETIASKVIIIRQDTAIDFCNIFGVSYYGKSIYRRYAFLYSMQRAIYIELIDAKVIVLDRLACKSKFEDAILPLDKSIQSYANESFYEHKIKEKMEFIYVIVNSMINGCGFKEADQEYLQNKAELLEDKTVKQMINKVYFNYSSRLIEHLKAREYDNAYKDWLRNVEY